MRTACSLDKAGDDGSNLHFATSIHDTSISFGMSHRKWRLLAGVERAPARIVQQQREVEVLALDVGDWRGGVRAATYVRIASEHLDVRSFLERGQFEVTVPGVGTHVVEQSDAEFALRILNHCFPNEN